MDDGKILQEAIMRLVETGGSISQDFGTGRIVGQVLVYLYLQESECSLDSIGEDLGLSKASVSIAVRQLERLGLAKKVWIRRDKRKYYKSADNIAKALQQGVLQLLWQKIQIFGNELDGSLELIGSVSDDLQNKDGLNFLRQRIGRAKKLQSGLERVLRNPLLKLLAQIKS